MADTSPYTTQTISNYNATDPTVLEGNDDP